MYIFFFLVQLWIVDQSDQLERHRLFIGLE